MTNRRLLPLFLPLFLVFQAITDVAQSQGKPIISTPEQFKEEFAQVPCKDADRLNAVKALFERLGAAATDITVEKFKNVENLIIRKPGATEDILIVGAHYDKVADGCGAIDNWTGIVAMAHLYKTIKEVPLKKTIWFVAFGKEEKGLIGSQAMTEAIKKEEVPKYCAMINIDSLGLAMPQVIKNLSSEKLTELCAAMAKKMDMPFTAGVVDNADADSSSFIKKKIPAVTITGLTKDWPSILHSSNDKSTKINEEAVYLGYRLALAVLATTSESPCTAYR
jgi:Iap family predicted aminopeptidase